MSQAASVALASCVESPETDPDARVLGAALAAAGIPSSVLAWDDPESDFGSARMTVLRSTWNYPARAGDFREWLEETAEVSDLWNPLPVVLWNLHKRYLLELETNGVEVVPTELLAQGEAKTINEIRTERGWHRVVVKPAISANSMNTFLIDGDDSELGEQHLHRLLSTGDVLVQPYLEGVEEYGERALIWIDGELTHTVRKSPRFTGSKEAVSKQALEISEAEADLATRAIDGVRSELGVPLLYARVDVAPGATGAPVVMELELIEPSLYFLQSQRALQRFVDAIARRLSA